MAEVEGAAGIGNGGGGEFMTQEVSEVLGKADFTVFKPL